MTDIPTKGGKLRNVIAHIVIGPFRRLNFLCIADYANGQCFA